MDALHTAGIRFAEALQSGPPWLEKFWISVTSLADPKCVFTVCFPLAYFLDRKVGVSVLWIGLVSEWLNVVLKWFLFGERPFWWIHESGLASKEPVALHQFPVSCETGPGDHRPRTPACSVLILKPSPPPRRRPRLSARRGTQGAGRAARPRGLGSADASPALLRHPQPPRRPPQPSASSPPCFPFAGSPSGHCMITGAALWPLVTALTALASRRSGSLAAKLTPFGAYALLLLAVGLSRVFVLAHFPHQVVGGILAGVALGWGLQARAPVARAPGFFVAAALALLLGSLALHSLVIAAGVDIDWSIRLAAKWCSDPAWLRLDTRPFASLCRDAGSALGLGLAAGSPPGRGERLDPRQRVAGALLALGALQGLHRLLRPADVTLWYGTSFLKYAAGPWLVASLLPRLVLSLARPRGSPHAE